jgi:pyruvate/2-oxoglutarate dehydrogenase complex dihydrolipoamide dehydrogenase (E3) component
MSTIETDICVIGAGSGGLSVAAGAAQLGVPTVLVERGAMGGDCLNHGCVPSKALLAAAHAAHAVRDAGRFGVRVPAPEIDFAAVRAHVRRAITAIEPNDSEARFTKLGVRVLRRHARFAGPDTVVLDDGTTIHARRIVVAAGARAAVPPMPGLDTVPYLTNETLWANETLPEHLVVLGGGVIGVEMAFAHRRLGSRVTIVEGAAVLAREDAHLAAGLKQVLVDEGVVLREGVKVLRVEPGPTLVLATEAGEERLTGSHLLVATGRAPNLDGLDLEKGGVTATRAGIAVTPGLVSVSNPKVFAVGDIADVAGIGPRQFTHVAGYHAGIVIRRALFRLPAKVDYRALPRVTFTDPELAQVGLTEAEAKAAGHTPQVLHWDMAENDRAIAEGNTVGQARLVLNAKGRLIGAGILAPHAGEMIGQWGTAIMAGVKLSAMAGQIIAYPTRAEAAKRAAGSYFTPQLFAPRARWLVRQLRRLG